MDNPIITKLGVNFKRTDSIITRKKNKKNRTKPLLISPAYRCPNPGQAKVKKNAAQPDLFFMRGAASITSGFCILFPVSNCIVTNYSINLPILFHLIDSNNLPN